MKKTALITGITGQDGAYLARHLLMKGYQVYGSYHQTPCHSWRLQALGIEQDITLIQLNLFELEQMIKKIETVSPDEVYHFAAQSFLSHSFEQPIFTAEINGLGTLRLLESLHKVNPAIRFFQASSAELFGSAVEIPQTEATSFQPMNPYGIAKLFAHLMTQFYRDSHDFHASSGIFFNHESPLRGEQFVTRKITQGLAAIKYQKRQYLELGNLDIKRDWGFAGDYVRAAYLMLQQNKADDYILATGETHSVREFVELAAQIMDMKIAWRGRGCDEIGIDELTGTTLIKINPDFYRPDEKNTRVGSSTKAKEKLGWIPEVSFKQLVEMMVYADLKLMAAK